MGGTLPARIIRPSAYVPTLPRTGNIADGVIYSLANGIIKGQGALSYLDCYAGSLSLSETIATADLAGTVALANGSTTVTGTGTAFTTELNPGQWVTAVNAATSKSHLLVVRKITSDTVYTCWRAPTETVSGLTAKRDPVVFSVDQDRGSQIWGDTIRLDKGTLLSVGVGTFRVNGSALNATLAVTRDPKISLFSSGAGTFTHFPLGMSTSAAPSCAAVAGGTKGMRAGNYSVVTTPGRTQTLGYNNPSLRGDVTIATNDRIAITFPAMDTTNGQNAWGVWVTRYADSLGSDLNYLEGPWYYYDQSTGSTAGYTANFEWYDAEVERNDLVTFNNDAPPDANFVAMLNNVPIWISCYGTNGSSPGPFIAPAKPGNIEAAPVEISYSSSPPETILGVVAEQGRLYLLTTNHLQIAQGTPQDAVPILIRPFWSVGFTGPNQLVFVNDMLYGHSVQGPARSASDGVSGSEEFDFAIDVSEITDTWVAGHVLVAYDPTNNAVCYINSGNELNSSGFWTTEVLMFGLRSDKWIGRVVLSSTTQDSIVSSAAMIGNSLVFLMGGRLANNTTSFGTYVFDSPAGTSVAWRAAAPFSDNGDELRSHTVKRVRVTGKTTSGSLGVFGFQSTEVIDVSLFATGNSASLTGAVSVPNTSAVALSQQFQVNCPNLDVSTIQVQGTYAGSGTVDRVDELIVESSSIGVRR